MFMQIELPTPTLEKRALCNPEAIVRHSLSVQVFVAEAIELWIELDRSRPLVHFQRVCLGHKMTIYLHHINP